MTWTYSGNPSASTRDEVRFLAGDIYASRPSHLTLSDEEIAYLVTQQVGAVGAAIAGCDALAARWAAEPESQSTGGVSISNGDMAAKFRATAAQLRARNVMPTPYLGGMSISDKATDEADSDMVGPRFRRGMDGDPEAPTFDDGGSCDAV